MSEADHYSIERYEIRTLLGDILPSWAVIDEDGRILTTAATRALAAKWLDGWIRYRQRGMPKQKRA